MNTAANARKAQCYLQHPEENPEPIGVLPYLIHPPSRVSPAAAWLAFRNRTLFPMSRPAPQDPDLPGFPKQGEAILAWRAAVSPEDRFWKADRSA